MAKGGSSRQHRKRSECFKSSSSTSYSSNSYSDNHNRNKSLLGKNTAVAESLVVKVAELEQKRLYESQ